MEITDIRQALTMESYPVKAVFALSSIIQTLLDVMVEKQIISKEEKIKMVRDAAKFLE